MKLEFLYQLTDKNGNTWNITSNTGEGLKDCDIDFIKVCEPVIYFNDLTCKYWGYDRKLPSGAWLENIEMNGENYTLNAIIIY